MYTLTNLPVTEDGILDGAIDENFVGLSEGCDDRVVERNAVGINAGGSEKEVDEFFEEAIVGVLDGVNDGSLMGFWNGVDLVMI